MAIIHEQVIVKVYEVYKHPGFLCIEFNKADLYESNTLTIEGYPYQITSVMLDAPNECTLMLT